MLLVGIEVGNGNGMIETSVINRLFEAHIQLQHTDDIKRKTKKWFDQNAVANEMGTMQVKICYVGAYSPVLNQVDDLVKAHTSLRGWDRNRMNKRTRDWIGNHIKTTDSWSDESKLDFPLQHLRLTVAVPLIINMWFGYIRTAITAPV